MLYSNLDTSVSLLVNSLTDSVEPTSIAKLKLVPGSE